MSHPLLVIKKLNDGTENFITSMAQFKKKPKAKKKVKAKVKAKKPAAKKEKVIDPPRLSPFTKGDEVWVNRGHLGHIKSKITKCIRPTGGDRVWRYETELVGMQVEESLLLPSQIFTMIATDVVRLREAEFTDVLNNTFEAETRILGVYRLNQKKPWAYYVIPDPEVLYKSTHWVSKQYVYNQPMEAILYVRPTKDIDLKLIPVSSAPQEILTYLGLHIYNRKWKREPNAT